MHNMHDCPHSQPTFSPSITACILTLIHSLRSHPHSQPAYSPSFTDYVLTLIHSLCMLTLIHSLRYQLIHSLCMLTLIHSLRYQSHSQPAYSPSFTAYVLTLIHSLRSHPHHSLCMLTLIHSLRYQSHSQPVYAHPHPQPMLLTHSQPVYAHPHSYVFTLIPTFSPSFTAYVLLTLCHFAYMPHSQNERPEFQRARCLAALAAATPHPSGDALLAELYSPNLDTSQVLKVGIVCSTG